METTISKWGNSQGLRLPVELVKSLNIDVGDKVNISLENHKIIIEPIAPKKIKYNLDDLLKQLPANYQPHEILSDTQGNEKW